MCLFDPGWGRGEMSQLPDGVAPQLPGMPSTLPGKKEHVLFRMWREAENLICPHPIALSALKEGI